MREVKLDSARYGLDPKVTYTFRRWTASRALGEMDWLASNFGDGAAETIAALAGALATGTTTPAEAAGGLGALTRAWGRADSWGAFLRMAACDETGGLWRAAGAVKAPGAMVWPADVGQQNAIRGTDLDPDVVFCEDPTEILRLMLAMVCESFAPFGAARASIARAWSSAAQVGAKLLAAMERSETSPEATPEQSAGSSSSGSGS